MHRITHDPRFTSWLHTQIYVSRPDKHTPPPECPSGQCISEFVCGRVEDENRQVDKADKVDESTSLLASYSKESWRGTLGGCDGCSEEDKGCSAGSSSGTCISSSASSITITNSSPSGCDQISSVPIKAGLPTRSPSSLSVYRYKSLPTFSQVSSSTVATVHAKKDLVATTIILVVPMIVFLLARAIPWEGTYKGEDHWCRTTTDAEDQHKTNRCLWPYAVLPGILHVFTASVLGYLGLWFARNTNLLQKRSTGLNSRSSAGYGSITTTRTPTATSRSATSAYRNLLQGLGGVVEPSQPVDNIRSTEIPVSKGSIQFKQGRIQVNHHIQELMDLGIGYDVDTQCGDEESMKKAKGGGVLVFGGGPDAFVDMIEESCKKARWDVDFHRETWAP